LFSLIERQTAQLTSAWLTQEFHPGKLPGFRFAKNPRNLMRRSDQDMKRFLAFVLAVLFCATVGCQNPSVVQISPGVYQLARADHGGLFGNKDALKAGVIQDANAFAESQGKAAIPVSAKEHPMGILGDWASYEYTFKAVKKDDPEAQIPKVLVRTESELNREFRSLGGNDVYYLAKPVQTQQNSSTSSSADRGANHDTPKSSGSGAIVSTDGYVLTAAHVVVGASRVEIYTVQGMKAASVLRVDEANDLAVLKLVGGSYPALTVAPSRKVRLGQPVATIGFPNVEIQGFSPKLTRGEISSLNGIGDDPRAWQISVPVQPGNSGGALLDEDGNVIGVVVSKLGLKVVKLTGDIPQNVNYAVKSTYALALLEPYLDGNAAEPNKTAAKPQFEDMISRAQQSVVLILVY